MQILQGGGSIVMSFPIAFMSSAGIVFVINLLKLPKLLRQGVSILLGVLIGIFII